MKCLTKYFGTNDCKQTPTTNGFLQMAILGSICEEHVINIRILM